MAAPLYDHDLGTYSDAFSDEVGITSKSNVGVDAISGVLMLTNAESGFTAPYHSSGYMVTSTILPVLVAEWGTVSIDATIPDGTSVRVQILDESNAVYSDTAFSGNMVGFTSFPVDISGLAVDRNAGNMSAKFGRIRVKVYLATDNTDITPEVNSITVSWTKTNGDVSGSGLSDGSLGMQGYTTSLISRNDQTSAFTFPVLNWVKALSNEWGGGILSRGPENVLYLKSNGGFSGESPKIYALDRDTGNDIWRRSLSGVSYSEPDHLLTYDNTMYFNDIFNDVLGSYDMTSGTIKWLKVHGYGHGSYVNVTDQGVIIYDQNKVSDAAENIYAVNPDGTERWVYPFDLTGTVVDEENVISSVEYQIDTTSGYWSICGADDGNFDEMSEEFTCAVDAGSLSEGSHTIYVRATDMNGNVTPFGSYFSWDFIYAGEEMADDVVEDEIDTGEDGEVDEGLVETGEGVVSGFMCVIAVVVMWVGSKYGVFVSRFGIF